MWTLLAPVIAMATPSSTLLRDLEHLRVVGSVLYVAAHPDDENTRLIAWLAGERGIRTAYLSLTRGGGGQNLVGAQQAELLGVIRTGELMAARAIDGGEQRFTRLRDFGYAKSAEASLAFWGHDEALDDVIRAIRSFRPDVIVTRFPTHGESHGHHLASARLAEEAFTHAADPAYVTEGLAPWAADRLVHNVSTWSLPKDADTTAWASVDVGTYDPRTGLGVGEIAAASRTMHKSQGFGTAPTFGPMIEYFASLAGTPVDPGQDLLHGLELGWARFEGTQPLDRALRNAAARFDPRRPEAVLPLLADAHAALAEVPDPLWRARKTADLERIMAEAAGLRLGARADRAAVAPGGALEVTVTALARLPAEVVVHGISIGGTAIEAAPWSGVIRVPEDAALTVPHWLAAPPTPARYTIPDPALRDLPESPASLAATFDVTLAGRRLTFARPVERAVTDPVWGERIHPVEILPPVTVTFAESSWVVPSGGDRRARITLAASAPTSGVLEIEAPPGITVTPSRIPFEIADQRVVDLRIAASADAAPGALVARARVGDRSWGWQQAVIDLPHLPRRTVLSPATQKVVPLVLDRGGIARIGYLTGSGDEVPAALRAAGYQVEVLDGVPEDLSRFDAVVTGIRAYNTRDLVAHHERLMSYVAGGGRLVVQYNTNNRLDPLEGPIGPRPFHISRLRVTDETAPIMPVDPSHPAWTRPNTLGPADFDGWVQERGLYFADAWDPAYETLLTSNDPGEAPLAGSTLVLRHGEGVFVYTGLSFFRQLPAGVPGAYRLFANLMAL